MRCLILAAGYATRLYPLTENFPKPLLPVNGRPILDWLVEDIDGSSAVDEYIVVSNHRFVSHFRDWARSNEQKITVIDDGTTHNDNRLGAVLDIQFAIDSLRINDDVLIIAGDNLLDFSLNEFISYAKSRKTSCVMRYYEPSKIRRSKSGVIAVDHNDLVLNMEEKPSEPMSEWCCPPFYYYKAEDIALISEGIKDGCGTDAPGSFVAWLCKRSPVHAMEMPGRRYDIGNLESYGDISRTYKGIKQ